MSRNDTTGLRGLELQSQWDNRRNASGVIENGLRTQAWNLLIASSLKDCCVHGFVWLEILVDFCDGSQVSAKRLALVRLVRRRGPGFTSIS